MHSQSVSPADSYISRLGTAHSRATAWSAVRALERAFGVSQIDWGSLTYADVARARARLNDLSVSWGLVCLSILRQLLLEGRRLGVVDGQLVEDAMALPRIRGAPGRLGRTVEDWEVEALCAAVDDTRLVGRRDGAILGLLLGGLRCSETTTVSFDDVDVATGRLTVRHGKGRVHRVVPLGPAAQTLIASWIDVHVGDGRLLRSIDRWENIGDSVSPRTVQLALSGLCERAGIDHLSPHALRAHQITSVVEHGDVFLAQVYAGHMNLSTTARYDRRGFTHLEAVIDRIDAAASRHKLSVAA